MPRRDVLAEVHALLADNSADRRDDGRVLQIELGLIQLRLPLRDLGLAALDLGFRDGDLLGPGHGRFDRGVSLGDFGARLFHRNFGGGNALLRLRDGGFLRFDGGFGGFRGGHRLVVLLLGNLVLGDQHLVALDVLRRFIRIGLGHAHVGLCRGEPRLRHVHLLFRPTDACGGVLVHRPSAAQGTAGGGRGQRNIGAGALQAGQLIVQIGPCLGDGHFVVPGVQLHEHVARLDELLVLHIHLDHVPAHARADRDDAAIDFGVVGGFGLLHLLPDVVTADSHNQEHYDADDLLHYLPPMYCFKFVSVMPTARASATFARLCA